MEGIETRTAEPVAVRIGEASAALQVDTTLYELDAVLRACYKYTDRCYLFLTREPESAALVNVFFMGTRRTSRT